MLVRVRSMALSSEPSVSAGAHGAVDLQAAPARGIDREVIFDDVPPQRAEVGEAGLLRLFEIASAPPPSRRRRGRRRRNRSPRRSWSATACWSCSVAWCGVNCQPGRGGDRLDRPAPRSARAISCGWPRRHARGRAPPPGEAARSRRAPGPSMPLIATHAPVESSTHASAGAVAVGLGDVERDGGEVVIGCGRRAADRR